MKQYNAVMLDLETFGNGINAAIVQLAVQPFDSLTGEFDRALGRKYNVSLDSCLAAGGRVDESTIAWWVGQAKSGNAMPSGEGDFIKDVLQDLRAMLNWGNMKPTTEKFTVWSQGANFDIPIVDGYCQRLGIRSPWRYSAARDTRTVYELAQERGWQKAVGEPTHDALEDCWRQIKELSDALVVVRNPGIPDTMVAGILFDFVGHATSEKEPLVLSSSSDAAPAAEAVAHFMTLRGRNPNCDADVRGWR